MQLCRYHLKWSFWQFICTFFHPKSLSFYSQDITKWPSLFLCQRLHGFHRLTDRLVYLLNRVEMTLIWTETTDFLIVWITAVAPDGKAGQSPEAIVLTPQSFYFIWWGGEPWTKPNHTGLVNCSLQTLRARWTCWVQCNRRLWCYNRAHIRLSHLDIWISFFFWTLHKIYDLKAYNLKKYTCITSDDTFYAI